MGTFIGHLIPGLAIVFLGLWHTVNSIHDYYVKGLSNFRTRFHYPLKSPVCRFEQHLELILILVFSLSSIILQIFDFQRLQFSFELDAVEHATMFYQLIVFAGFSLFAELNRITENVSGISGILASSVFGTELFLLHYHSTDHIGLEGHYHWLMQLIVSVSLFTSLLVTIFPSVFSAALLLSLSVTFQGLWFIDMGFVLWVREFIPRGCVSQIDNLSNNTILGTVVCESREADLRARASANLQFCWIFSSLLIFAAFICAVFARRCEPKSLSPSQEYERLSSKDLAKIEFKQIQLM